MIIIAKEDRRERKELCDRLTHFAILLLTSNISTNFVNYKTLSNIQKFLSMNIIITFIAIIVTTVPSITIIVNINYCY